MTRFAIFAILFLLAAAGDANADTYTAELDALATKPDLRELVARVNQPRNIDEARAGLNWLRDKSISGFGGARIHYSYAYQLFSAGITETAAFANLLGLLTGRVDAARCMDSTAPGDKLQRWDQSLAPILKHFLSLVPEKRTELVALAVAMEQRQSNRTPDVWLCSGGVSFMLKYSERQKSDTAPPTREAAASSEPGRKTILLDDPDIKPEFVSDEEWQVRRTQLVGKFLAQFSGAK